MSLSDSWRQLHDHRWSVAQVRADVEDVVRILISTGQYAEVPLDKNKLPFSIQTELTTPIMLYRRKKSSWTCLEGIYGIIGDGLRTVSADLRADVLLAGFEDNVGVAFYEFFRCGNVVQAYMTGPAEFVEPSSDCYDSRTSDGVERVWKTNASLTRRFFSEAPEQFDIESCFFEDRWEAVSDMLGLDIPYCCWSYTPEPSQIELEPGNNDVNTKTARLLDIS